MCYASATDSRDSSKVLYRHLIISWPSWSRLGDGLPMSGSTNEIFFGERLPAYEDNRMKKSTKSRLG